MIHIRTLTHTHQVNDSLVYVDGIVESIFAGLKERGVKECVNAIIISDRGMARLGTRKFVELSKVISGFKNFSSGKSTKGGNAVAVCGFRSHIKYTTIKAYFFPKSSASPL